MKFIQISVSEAERLGLNWTSSEIEAKESGYFLTWGIFEDGFTWKTNEKFEVWVVERGYYQRTCLLKDLI